MNYEKLVQRVKNFREGTYFNANKKTKEIKKNLDENYKVLYTHLKRIYNIQSDIIPMEILLHILEKQLDIIEDKSLKLLLTELIPGISYYQHTAELKNKTTKYITLSKEKYEEIKRIEIPETLEIDYLNNLISENNVLVVINGGPILFYHKTSRMDAEPMALLYTYKTESPTDFVFSHITHKSYTRDGKEYVHKNYGDLMRFYADNCKEYSKEIEIPDILNTIHSNLVAFINIIAYINSTNVAPNLVNCGETGTKHLVKNSKKNSIKDFVFVDIDQTKYTYTKSQDSPESEQNKAAHWRRAHYHSYWIGKKDNQKRILHFIPSIWVGDPSKKTTPPTYITMIK